MPREIPYIDTTVSVEKTVAEIEEILRIHKATLVQKRYDNGRIQALSFIHSGVPFQLPAKVDSLYQVIATAKKSSPRSPYRWGSIPKDIERAWYAQAERCAWRNVMAWVKAQLALVEIGLVTVTEVFLPYMLVGSQETLYDRMLTDGFQDVRALGPGGEITVEAT